MRFRHFTDVVARLEGSLHKELPGAAAHAALAPRPRRGFTGDGSRPEHGTDSRPRFRLAAGLLLVFPIAERAHIVLTVRADSLGRHGGQVSLPGGVIEPGETFEQAALREAHEEVALATDCVRVLGPLTPLDIPVTGFRLHPIVAAADTRPVLRPADEVARILEIAVDELLDPTRFVSVERVRDGQPIVVPAFRAAGEEIWGATAMLLAEFLTLLGWRGAGVA